ncbi:MAG TPA: hypothetical protein VEX67_02690 [Solirubrobacteraceae bacterium]|nr:hypothetical protein [Solirubrobacteraceae bacterium]
MAHERPLSTASPERRRFARNAAAAYGERAVLMLSALLLTPYLFRGLGIGGFGTWSVMFTIVSVFSVLELGVSIGITTLVADARARGAEAERAAIVAIGIGALALVGVAGCVVAVGLGVAADGLAATAHREDFRVGMAVLGVALLIRFPCIACGAVLAGEQRYDLVHACLALTWVGFAAGAVFAVEAGAGVLGVAVAYATALTAGACGFVIALRQIDPQLSLRPRIGATAQRRRLLGFSSYALLADSMVFVGQRMDTVVVAAIRGAAAAAPIAAASRLQSGLQALSLPVVNLMLPMVAELWARGEREVVVRRHALATRITLQLTLPIAAWVALFSQDIVDVWLGPTAPEVTAAIVALLAAQTLLLSATPAEKVLVGIGRVRVVGWLNSAEGLTNLVLSIVLVTQMGVLGAALGSLISSILLGPLKWPVACRALGVSTTRFVQASVGSAVLSSLPALAAMAAVLAALPAGAARAGVGLVVAVLGAGAVALAQAGPRRVAEQARRIGRRS